MPILDIECSRVVHYHKNLEVTEEQATAFQAAQESMEGSKLEEILLSWIDPLYDVVEADEFELLNATITKD